MAKNHNTTRQAETELHTEVRKPKVTLRPGKTARDKASGAQQRLKENRDQRAPRQPKKDRSHSDFDEVMDTLDKRNDGFWRDHG